MIQAAAFGWSAWRCLAPCESVMVLLKSPYHLCLVTLLPILLAAPIVMEEMEGEEMCRLGVEVQLEQLVTLQAEKITNCAICLN